MRRTFYNGTTFTNHTMKRIITSLVLALLVPASALALSPSEKLTDFNNWLQDNDQYGVNYINSQLKQTKATAHEEWDDRAALYDFTFYAPAEQDLYCEFLLSSQDTDENDYKGSCTADDTPLTELIDNNPDIEPRFHIYRVGFLMRELVPAILEDERALPLLDSLFDEDAIVSLTFNLSKNSDNQLVWTVTFTDDVSGTSYLLKASAENNENPLFLILGQRSK